MKQKEETTNRVQLCLVEFCKKTFISTVWLSDRGKLNDAKTNSSNKNHSDAKGNSFSIWGGTQYRNCEGSA